MKQPTARLLIAVLQGELTVLAATRKLRLSDSAFTAQRFFRLIEKAVKADPDLKADLINSLQR